jgi:hypothetical protein
MPPAILFEKKGVFLPRTSGLGEDQENKTIEAVQQRDETYNIYR